MGPDTGAASEHLVKVENFLGMMMLALVWMVPNHQLPWNGFHHELLMGVFLALFCLIVGWQTRWRVPISGMALAVLMIAFLPWFQWILGLIPKAGTAFISSAYVVAFAFAIINGQADKQSKNQRLLHILFGALVVSALLNVPVQILQWFQFHSRDLDSILLMLVTPVQDGQRPSGMILQPNQLATLQVWGLISLTWFRYRRSINLLSFVAIFAVLVIGISLTRSRTGLLEVILVTFLTCWMCWKSKFQWHILFAWIFAFTLLVMLELNFVRLAEWFGVSNLTISSRLAADDGARLFAWQAYLAASFERPWLGYGLADLGYAYVALAEQRPDLYFGRRFAHAHNVLLDLILWVGIPLGVAMFGGFMFWLYRRVLVLSDNPLGFFPVAIILTFGLHSMLELPHHFLYFLIPVGICVGSLVGAENLEPRWSLPHGVWFVLGGIVVLALVAIARDYFPYQDRYTEWRYENQRVGTRPNILLHEPLVLNQLRDEIELYRLPLSPNLSIDTLSWIDETARSVNSPQAYYFAAKAFSLSNRLSEAQVWMMRFNAIMSFSEVENIKQIWRRDQELHPELAEIEWPRYQGRDKN